MLSKSRFGHGLQCLKQLWWRVHQPDAPELTATAALQALFDRGHLVGERARAEFPGGTLIGREQAEYAGKIEDTRAALQAGARAIFEASFSADGVFAAVDVLERRSRGFDLIEVKSSVETKPPHLPDVAIQLHVLRRAGVEVSRAEVMHLNRDCRFPDLSDLFVRDDVTAEAEAFLPAIPGHLERMRAALAGPLPVVEVGPHCDDPYECPFKARCWPTLDDDHVSRLYYANRVAPALLAGGIELIRDIPEGTRLSEVQARQVRAVRSGALVVEGPLARSLAALVPPVAYLDFETIAPAIPVWPGCGPYMAVPVQLSCHLVGTGGGAPQHHQHLAEGPGDPRPAMAAAVVRAAAGARTVVAYNAPFERRCLDHLAAAVPSRRQALLELAGKLVDLLPIVRDHVYHPGFGGSFSMKVVAPALVPGIDYAELSIGEGGTASNVLEALLLGDGIDADDRGTVRAHLLEYCALDTLAMVKIVERLRQLAG
jgi:hypothetical protein